MVYISLILIWKARPLLVAVLNIRKYVSLILSSSVRLIIGFMCSMKLKKICKIFGNFLFGGKENGGNKE